MALAHAARLALAVASFAIAAPAAVAAPSQAGAVLIRQPGLADAARIAGVTTLRILARAGERVREADLDSSSGNAAFDAAALTTVKRWRYVPAWTGGSAEPEWLLVRMIYGRPTPLIRSARR